MLSWGSKAVCISKQGLLVHGFKKDDGKRCVLERNQVLAFQDTLITCNVALDNRTGIHRIFCVVSMAPKYSRSPNMYELQVYDDVANCVSTVLSFKAEACSVSSDHGEFCILNGPTVVWSEGATIHLVCSGGLVGKKALQRSINALLLADSKFKDLRSIDRFWSFDWNIDDSECRILIFLRLLSQVKATSSSNANSGAFEWMNLLVQFDGNKLSVDKLASNKFLPAEYGQIASSVTLHSKVYLDPVSCSLLTKYYFLVGTSYQQVIVFEDGRLINCIPLESTPRNTVALQTIDDSLAVAVCDCSGRVSAFKLGEAKTEKVGSWEGVAGVLTGDFVGLGHKQLLLLFESGGSDDAVEFFITDLVEFSEGSSQSPPLAASEEVQPSSESLVTAVKALKLRRQKGEAYLVELERELEEKVQLLRNSLHFMTSLEDKKHFSVAKPDPSLVCVIPGKIEQKSEIVSSREHTSLAVVTSWQRVLDEMWNIGIVIKNTSESVVNDIGVTLVLQHGESSHKSNSRVVWIENVNSSNPPALKKQKHEAKTFESDSALSLHPGCSACAVVTSQLSGFEEAALTGWLVGKWREGNKDGSSFCCDLSVAELAPIELSLEMLNSGDYSCSEESFSSWCGEKMLPSYSDSKQDKDIACLLATRKLAMVTVNSPPSSTHHLSSLPAAMLRERLPLPSRAILPPPLGGASSNTPLNPGVCASRDKPLIPALDGVLVHIVGEEDNAELTILYRNDFQLSLLLATMQKVLPDRVTVCLHAGAASSATTLARWLNDIRHEIDVKTEHFEQIIAT